MMDLTPLDVRKKREDFRRVVRGYDPVEVDGFLELVADRLEDLVGRELRCREQTEMLREQLQAFRDRERALNEALVTAQELREEARAQAETAAELRLREAERQADAIRRDSDEAVQRARRGLDEIRVRRSGFLRSLRATIEHFLAEIEEEERRGVDRIGSGGGPGAIRGEDGAPGDAGDRESDRPREAVADEHPDHTGPADAGFGGG